MRDLYAVIGVTPDADPDVIDAAYRALMKKYHPDRRGRQNNTRAQEINEAYAVLRDEQKRRAYDASQKATRDRASSAIVKHRPIQEDRGPEGQGPHTRSCPDCAETIRAKARVCRYCGATLTLAAPKQNSAFIEFWRRRTRWWDWVIVAAVVLLLLVRCAASGPQLTRATPAAEAPSQPPPVEAAGPTPSTAEAAEQSVSDLLRAGDAHACTTLPVRQALTNYVLAPLDNDPDKEFIERLKPQITVSLTEFSEDDVNPATSQMTCQVNAHITAAGSAATVPITYVLKPALEPDSDVVISGDWGRAQHVIGNVIMMTKLSGSDEAAPPIFAP